MSKYWEPPEGGVGGPEPIAPIHAPDERKDGEITEGVRVALQLDPDVPEGPVEVRTERGIVYLHGTVSSPEIRQKIVDDALGVEGVVDVRDHLRVSED